MLRFFALLTGDRHAILLTHSPASRKKVVAMGMGLLLVTGLWIFTGYNLAVNAFDFTPTAGVFVGLVLGCVVFSLDRMILLGTSGKGLMPALRVSLAILMSLVGGVGIDFVLLHSEIDQSLASIHEGSLSESRVQVEVRYADRLNKAKVDVDQAKSDEEQAVASWVQEMNGAPSGTGKYGAGKVAAAKRSLVEKQEVELQAALLGQAHVLSEMNAEVDQAMRQLKELQRSPGLFDRLHAMHRYMGKDLTVLVAYWIITLIMFLVELSPVLVKWGMGKTAYEEEIELADQLHRERSATSRILQQRLQERQRMYSLDEHHALAQLQDITQQHSTKTLLHIPVDR